MKLIRDLLLELWFCIINVICGPVFSFWMLLGACVGGIIYCFRCLFGKILEEGHPPYVLCTQTNRCAECRKEKRRAILWGCLGVLGSVVLIGGVTFFVYRFYVTLGVIPTALLGLAIVLASILAYKEVEAVGDPDE